MKKISPQITAVFLALMTFAWAPAGHANFSANRFDQVMTELEASLSRVASKGGFFEMDPKDQAKALIGGGVRMGAFNLQALSRMYGTYPNEGTKKFLDQVRDQAKELEDGLGRYDKYKGSGKKNKAEEAAQKLSAMIQKRGWIDKKGRSPLIKKMKTQLASAAWLSAPEERKFILEQLAGQLDSLINTKYDMRLLEAGLHELRREVRWLTISVGALDGLVVQGNRACPLRRALFKEYADSKYSFPVRSQQPQPCVVTACVATEIVGAVGIFGELKDEAEPIVLNDPGLLEKDLVPPATAKKAQQAYKAFMESGVLEHARKEIGTCR